MVVERIRKTIDLPQETKGIVVGKVGVKVYRFDKNGKLIQVVKRGA